MHPFAPQFCVFYVVVFSSQMSLFSIPVLLILLVFFGVPACFFGVHVLFLASLPDVLRNLGHTFAPQFVFSRCCFFGFPPKHPCLESQCIVSCFVVLSLPQRPHLASQHIYIFYLPPSVFRVPWTWSSVSLITLMPSLP